MDLDPIFVASVRRYTAGEWRWACLRSCLWLQGKEMRTNLPVMLGAYAIPLSKSSGMSTAYPCHLMAQSDQELLLWCSLKKRNNCAYHISYHMRHNSSEKT